MTLPPAQDETMGLAAGFDRTSPDEWAQLAAAVVNKSRPEDRKVDADGARGALRETSRFVREGGAWYYVDGDVAP